MAYKLTWLAGVLRAAGLKVIEQPGWQSRGHGDMGTVRGVLCHHTAGARKGNAPSLNICLHGRPDLEGPLSQLVLGRDGTFYVLAAGKCWHAGAGRWRGITAGNSEMIGIEAENTGNADDHPWPAVQMDAYERGVAAILDHIGADPIMAAGHLEYALPVGRKPDPSFSIGSREDRIRAMNAFRTRVGALLAGQPRADFTPVKPAPGAGGADDDSDDAAPIAPAKPPALPDEVPGPTETGLWALVKKWKGRLSTLGVGTLGIGAITDWRAIAVVLGAVILLAIGVVALMGPANVRGWIRRQVNK